MSFIELRNISKIYRSEDGQESYALNHLSLSLPEKGLVAIVGKSGSGKSTIINLLALLDKPTLGHLYINRENVEHWKKKAIEKYHNQTIGIVFQHYHLLENHTVLFNIMMPSLIKGNKEKIAKEEAKNLLESISFPKNLYDSLCKNLSGGEKERVTLLRAVINNPQILLCDEPTGALDSKNAKLVMEILKEFSKDRLVIVVSHNIPLTKEYADRIITLKEGKIEKDETINAPINVLKPIKKSKCGKNKKWLNKITFDNFKRRIVRNLISIVTLVIGLVASLLIIGFANGSTPSIKESSFQQLDYGVVTLSKQKSENITGSKMSIIQQSRPSFTEVQDHTFINDNYEIENNFSALLPNFCNIQLGEEKLSDFSYHPIYSFLDNYVDKNLLIEGYFPSSDNLSEAVINQKAYDLLIRKGAINPLSLSLDISFDKEFHYYTGDEQNPCINDIFFFQKTIHIVGVVKEMNFLSTPKIYYSYRALVDYLFEYPMNNLSTYFERKITWYERVATANGNDEISSYSYYLFLKDINDAPYVSKHITSIKDPYVLESTPVSLSEALLDLVNAATMGMEIFLFISILGTVLILGIVSFSSYSEDKKIIAILSCLGASRNDITDIYVLENIIVALISLTISFIASPLLSLLANLILLKTIGFSSMVVIPFSQVFGVPLFLPILTILITIFVATFATLLPIIFSSKISLKKELTDE